MGHARQPWDGLSDLRDDGADGRRQDGTPALIRDGHLTKSERRVLVFGLVGTPVTVLMVFVEIAVGLPARETAVLAVMIATGAGLVGFLALVRDDAPQ